MRRQLVLRRDHGEEETVPAGEPMSPEAARLWLDDAFVQFDCVPVRPTGKVLTVDKVIAIAQAAGRDDWDDPQWAGSFSAAALTALGRDEPVTIDLVEARLR